MSHRAQARSEGDVHPLEADLPAASAAMPDIDRATAGSEGELRPDVPPPPPSEPPTPAPRAPASRRPSRPPHPRLSSRQRRQHTLVRLSLAVALALIAALATELRHARLQSYWFHRYATTLTWQPAPGASDAIVYPTEGPFDKRLGYAYLPQMLERLTARGFAIQAQSRFSPELLEYARDGYFPPYREKTATGLTLADCRGEPLFAFRYPGAGYANFDDIPPAVVATLLYIENQHLLDPQRPRANPAVDWPRLATAAVSQAGRALELQDRAVGGSTLATQVEKVRHSPDGMTPSVGEKLRQMVSGSVRAYRAGRETLPARRAIVRDHLNNVPLSAAPGHGEVHGLADGLRVWFGADFAEVNRLLDPARAPEASAADRALPLRQVLALLIAQRRPSYYLAQGRPELAALTDEYLRLLAEDEVIDADLGQAATERTLTFRDWQLDPVTAAHAFDKGMSGARLRLAGLLGKPLYDLDRLDLTATSTLDGALQDAVSAYLAQLAEPEFAREAGLLGDRLLSAGKVHEVRYSFILYERRGDRFAVRVQTDNTEQPFDLNQASKLELGSTAKLRVLATYLEIIAELHARHAGRPADELRDAWRATPPDDALTRWTLDHLLRHPDHDLAAVLDAALERRYSASPHERFFTGGGVHTFRNFQRRDDGRRPSVREALRESINLPYVRLLRDIVRYTIHQTPGSSADLLRDDADPRRRAYLERFADREGVTFLRRFWRKYRALPPEQQLPAFLDGVRKTPVRLAAAHRYLVPEATPGEFASFLTEHLPRQLDERQTAALYRDYGPGKFSLSDQAYLARVHPLELWLLGYLQQRPQAGFDEIVADSHAQRQEVYDWLFRSRHRSARDTRVRIMLEVEAFLEVHRRWQRHGYPFGHLVPSLATAIGSSGDRPDALAELVGTLLNDGVRLPTARIDTLHFAAGTPYETRLSRTGEGERVFAPEVAAALREVLSQVVEGGTARRLQGSFALADGNHLPLGGKTGTGDNRIEAVAPGGRVIASRPMNRTATFVFFLGDHHFGTLTAYVPGDSAATFRFTSALPVQALRSMAPILTPYLDEADGLCHPTTAAHYSYPLPPAG